MEADKEDNLAGKVVGVSDDWLGFLRERARDHRPRVPRMISRH